jgi:hypothetical protein
MDRPREVMQMRGRTTGVILRTVKEELLKGETVQGDRIVLVLRRDGVNKCLSSQNRLMLLKVWAIAEVRQGHRATGVLRVARVWALEDQVTHPEVQGIAALAGVVVFTVVAVVTGDEKTYQNYDQIPA